MKSDSESPRAAELCKKIPAFDRLLRGWNVERNPRPESANARNTLPLNLGECTIMKTLGKYASKEGILFRLNQQVSHSLPEVMSCRAIMLVFNALILYVQSFWCNNISVYRIRIQQVVQYGLVALIYS